MKRGILLIVMLLLLVDLASDGSLGEFNLAPHQAAVSHVLCQFSHFLSSQVDFSKLLPILDLDGHIRLEGS